jgi:carboxypeptidase PM20D1
VQDWEHPPFSGAVADGFIWGRGTLDLKIGAVGLLEATTALLHEGAMAKCWRQVFYLQRHTHTWLRHVKQADGSNGAAHHVS